MLKITIPETELFNDRTGEFIKIKEQVLNLEHSLVSISKWEAIFNKPFLSNEEKTNNETYEYLKCMTINQNVDENAYKALTAQQIKQISDYINAPMTATTFSNQEGKSPSRQILTSEMIYYYMIAYNIPSEYQKWHLNRLMVLLRVCGEKNAPKKTMSKASVLKQNAAINAARRKASGSKG